ncbi:MAG: ethanolamine ammonia-lyase subunit EutC [Planctomycetaceae bacterium]
MTQSQNPASDLAQRGATADPWEQLRALTAARIALGRCGGSLPTHELLDFGLAHARARDAVHAEFDPVKLADELQALGIPSLQLASEARDRWEYLRRPDLGRKLSAKSKSTLNEHMTASAPSDFCYDLSIMASDGLSATAVHQQVIPLLRQLWPRLGIDGWRLSPVGLVRYGRVGIQDEIGELMGARIALMLIGERPGLGSPNSLGAYFVYGPRAGLTDADRNCISNIREEGLRPEQAAATIYYLLNASRQKQLSGVTLKDDREVLKVKSQRSIDNEASRE